MNALNGLLRDLLYGLRFLTRSPGFSTVAILSLAVGIGANTAIFSIVNSLLLRPRPVSNPQELLEVYVGRRQEPYHTSSYPSYLDIRGRNGVFSGLAAYGIRQFTFTEIDAVEEVWGEVVTNNYFDVLGVQLAKGRPFQGVDDLSTTGQPVVVIGHALWQRRFGGDPDIIGRAVSLNGQKLTIVGVAPAAYTGYFRGLSSEIWIPATTLPDLEPSNGRRLLTSRGNKWLLMIGRLKPGVTADQARARFEVLSLEMQASQPEEWKQRYPETGEVRELFATVVTESEGRVPPEMQAAAWAVVALVVVVVNVVLLIACMNLAGMLLARAVARRKEFAIRLAIGAGRWRLVRQLVTESVLLALVAGVAGVVLTIWMLQVLLTSLPVLPEGMRVAFDIRVDWRVMAYAAAFATLTGVLFGLIPALQSSRQDVSAVLKNDIGGAAGYRRSRGRRVLVVLQVAFSLLLLIGAGLVLRSLDKVRPTSLGFTSTNMLMVSLKLDEQRYDRARRQEFYAQLVERVTALPGISGASLIDGIPGGFLGSSRSGTEIEGYQPARGERLEIESNTVGPRYFTNMNVPIVQGRDFDERDREGAPCVAIVNEAFVQRYLGSGGPALGRRLAKYDWDNTLRKSRKSMCDIVGVIRDDRWQSLRSAVKPFFVLPALQTDQDRMMLFVHAEGDPASQLKPVRAVVQGLDPFIPLNDMQTLTDAYDAGAFPFRVLGIIMGASGLMALLLAVIGIYGIVSYSVAQRTREVGIRVALGASRDGILRMVIRQGMTLVIWGLAIGLVLSFALTRVLTSDAFETEMLFGVSATDTLTFAGVTIMLALVALAACWVPARRAARLNPIQALRYD